MVCPGVERSFLVCLVLLKCNLFKLPNKKKFQQVGTTSTLMQEV